MNISTFRDNNYPDMNKIGVFSWITHVKKGKQTYNVYCNKEYPEKLMQISRSLEKQKANFERLFDDNLSDTEFFEIYKDFYQWDNDAIIADILSELFPQPVTTTVKTDDVVSGIESEGHGRDFSWWTVWHNSAYKVLANQDFKLDTRRVYTKQEIADLVSAGKLVVLKTGIPYGEELENSSAYKTSKKLEAIDLQTPSLHARFDYYPHAISSQDIEAMYITSPKAFASIRKHLSKKQLSEDYARYMVEYDRTMSEIEAALNDHIQGHKNSITQSNEAIKGITSFLEGKKTKVHTFTTPIIPSSTASEMVED